MSCTYLAHHELENIFIIIAIIIAGDSWTTFNSAQTLTRRNMVVMYGNKRQLFQPNKVANFVRHVYPSVFVVQVGACIRTHTSKLACANYHRRGMVAHAGERRSRARNACGLTSS